MQKEISVAFQGGGAKLVGLIAAAHALSELESAEQIRIRAVSGSSAGSIAACLLAAGADFDQVKVVLRRLQPKIDSYFSTRSRIGRAWRIIRFMLKGESIYPLHILEAVVHDVLKSVNINPEIQVGEINPRKRLYLIYTDIIRADVVCAPENEIIKTAITRSCALPVVFSSFRELGGGKHTDGGWLNNLPTDVLMEGGRRVFAIGFKPEPREAAKSTLEYLYSLLSAGVQNRVVLAKRAIGEDMVLELDTSINTLEFNKIEKIGLDQEYNRLKEETKQFFRSYINGSARFRDPLSETIGKNPSQRLELTERSICHYIRDNVAKSRCSVDYLAMRVNAFSLIAPSRPDEIIIEELLTVEKGSFLKGLILPLINGDGYTDWVECNAYLDGPGGRKIESETLRVRDPDHFASKPGTHTNVTVLLFKEDPQELTDRKIYFIKKEERHGFMSNLRNNPRDHLAMRTVFWPAGQISIALTVPRTFPKLDVLWKREGDSDQSAVEADGLEQRLIPGGFVCYAAKTRNVGLNGRLHAEFTYNKPY